MSKGRKIHKKPRQRPRLKPLSLYPLKPEEASRVFMQIRPEDVGIKARREK